MIIYILKEKKQRSKFYFLKEDWVIFIITVHYDKLSVFLVYNNCHDITDILLKVALNTIKQLNQSNLYF
jgi:hypothetical protein